MCNLIIYKTIYIHGIYFDRTILSSTDHCFATHAYTLDRILETRTSLEWKSINLKELSSFHQKSFCIFLISYVKIGVVFYNLWMFVAELQGKGCWQGGCLHNDDGYRPQHVPAVREGEANPPHAPGEVWGTGCVHEQRVPGWDQGQDAHGPDTRATGVCRRAARRGE